jgi:hypothetical protein
VTHGRRESRHAEGFKATIVQLLQEIDRLQRGRPDVGRESRELRAKVAQLEADNARLRREIEPLRNAKPKAQRRKTAPWMDRGTFAKIARALHPDGRGGRTAADLDDACKAFNVWWEPSDCVRWQSGGKSRFHPCFVPANMR